MDNVTFDKYRDELQDITVNWGHSLLYLSAASATTTPLFNSFNILKTVCFQTLIAPRCYISHWRVIIFWEDFDRIACCVYPIELNFMLSDDDKEIHSQDQRLLASALWSGGRIIQTILAPVCSAKLICHRLQSIMTRSTQFRPIFFWFISQKFRSTFPQILQVTCKLH